MTNRNLESPQDPTRRLHAVLDLRGLHDIDYAKAVIVYQGDAVRGTGADVLARHGRALAALAVEECKPEEV